jgi:hypothetical protein
MPRWALTALVMFAACGDSLGSPKTVPLPAPENKSPLLGSGPRSPRIASYVIDATFDADTHRLVATQTLTWKNTGSFTVESLPFHLYMNAFKNDDSVFMIESGGQHRTARASDSGWGWIELTSVKVNGEDRTAAVAFNGPDETVVEVPLATAIGPGQTASIDMSFTTQLPEVFARTGYKGHFTMVGQWFPKIGVRVPGPDGTEGWHCEPFHLNSEFFADFGTYDVSLTVPDTHVIAATGVLTGSNDNGDGTRTLVYRAEDVHDFAWMADPFMKMMSGTAETELGDVEVQVYYRAKQESFAKRHLQAGIGSIEEFSRRLVPYPWAIMRIIDPPPRAAGGAGGMEYPTLVTTAADSVFTRDGVRLPEYVTVHEVGHNWLQGILASNEIEEAWMDEGVNDYMDGLVMTALYGDGRSIVDWLGFRMGPESLRRAIGGPWRENPSPIATASHAFVDNSAYGQASYAKTGAALRTLEHVVGNERFADAMRDYAKRWAFRHPTGADFFQSLRDSLGEDIAWFVDPAFRRVGGADFRVRSVDCAHPHEPRGVHGRGEARTEVPEADAPDSAVWSCGVTIANIGTVPVPVEIEITLANGDSEIHTWDHRDLDPAWHTLVVERDSPVAEVHIDPEGKVPLNDGLFGSWHREGSDSAAARRAAARAEFWTQSVMQMVGL